MIDTSKLNFFSIKEIVILESGRWDLLLDTGTLVKLQEKISKSH